MYNVRTIVIPQVDDMVNVIGDSLNLNATDLSQEERSYLYMIMQKKLAYQTLSKKPKVIITYVYSVSKALNVYTLWKINKCRRSYNLLTH